MAQITKAVFTTPKVVVKDAEFDYEVQFQTSGGVAQNVLDGTLTYQDFSGPFTFDSKYMDTVTADSKFAFRAIATRDGEHAITVDLESIRNDDANTMDQLDGEGQVTSDTIEVIECPDFEVFTHTDKTFNPAKFFENPLAGETDNTTWTITGTFDPDDGQIEFNDQNMIVVDDIDESFVDDNKIGANNFVDVIISATAENDAGTVTYYIVLRVKSSKPTKIARKAK